MKLKTVWIILGSVLLLFFLVRYVVESVKNTVRETFGGIPSTRQSMFKNTDFSSGRYALIIDDEEPAILVDDAVALEANKNQIHIDKSWMTYLPGEGRSSYGIRLYEDNHLKQAILARKFNHFVLGDLKKFGKPLDFKTMYEPREVYLNSKDSLEKLPDVYMERSTDVNGFNYRFTLRCPSILVSDMDSVFNAYAYGRAFAKRISDRFSDKSDFTMGDNALNSSEPSPLLVLKKEGITYNPRNSETGQTMVLEGYTLHGAQLVVFCSKPFYDQLKASDFDTTFERAGVSEAHIRQMIRQKIGPETDELQLEAVYTSMFDARFEWGELYENKYELRYFQVKADGYSER